MLVDNVLAEYPTLRGHMSEYGINGKGYLFGRYSGRY
jgi:hypothetical protein